MNGNPKSLHERLNQADKELRRIHKTGSEAARRVLLGGLLFELVAIEKAEWVPEWVPGA